MFLSSHRAEAQALLPGRGQKGARPAGDWCLLTVSYANRSVRGRRRLTKRTPLVVMRNHAVPATATTDTIPTPTLQEMEADRGTSKTSPVTPGATLGPRSSIRLHEQGLHFLRMGRVIQPHAKPPSARQSNGTNHASCLPPGDQVRRQPGKQLITVSTKTLPGNYLPARDRSQCDHY